MLKIVAIMGKDLLLIDVKSDLVVMIEDVKLVIPAGKASAALDDWMLVERDVATDVVWMPRRGDADVPQLPRTYVKVGLFIISTKYRLI